MSSFTIRKCSKNVCKKKLFFFGNGEKNEFIKQLNIYLLILLHAFNFISIYVEFRFVLHLFPFGVEYEFFEIAEWIVKEQGQDCRRCDDP